MRIAILLMAALLLSGCYTRINGTTGERVHYYPFGCCH